MLKSRDKKIMDNSSDGVKLHFDILPRETKNALDFLLEAARIPRPLGGGDEWPHNELCARWGAPCQQSFPGAPPHTPPR